MNVSMKVFIVAVLVAALAAFLFEAAHFYIRVQKSKSIVKASMKFERVEPSAKMKVLVLGDSTAVGTGSEKPEFSTAGRLAKLYPEASIKNVAVNGMKLAGLLTQLETLDPSEQFSIILVQIGANDIIRLTNIEDIKRDAEKVFARLSQQSEQFVVLHSGDIGEAKIFPFYVRPILSKRSFEMRDIYKKLASRYKAQYVDLIDSPVAALLRDQPETYYAEDLLHLNAAGYALWFEEIQKVLE